MWNPYRAMRLRFPDDSGTLQVIQPVDLKETGEIINGHHGTLVVEQLGGNFGPKAVWNVMNDDLLLLLSFAVESTRFVPKGEIFYITL